jgi:hypothetical protein
VPAVPRTRSLLLSLAFALAALMAAAPIAGADATASGAPLSTSPCPPGQGPTTISKRVSLAEAAAIGAVKLTSKGGFDKDAVAVDATWKPSKAPVTVQIDVEFSSFPGGPTAAEVEAAIESKLTPRTASDGTKVNFDIVARERAPGAAASPCFHQMQLTADSEFRGEAGEADSNPLKVPQSGEWPSGRGATGDRQIWTHEALHLAGLPDQYGSFYRVGKKDYPVPDSVDIADKDAVKEWAESKGLDPNGHAGTKPKPGHEQDIMGDTFGGSEKLLQSDVDKFAKQGAGRLTVEAKPGEILLNKDTGSQNLAVGAPVELTAEPGKPAHVDGLVGYCIDLSHHSPAAGQGFDVLGLAGDQPQPAMQYLQRVLEVAAAQQPLALQPTPGAQEAVWRISDDSPTEEGIPILNAAGVPDQVFEAPHFADPNAASPETAAVTTTGVLPAPAPVPYLTKIQGPSGALAVGEADTLTARVTVTLAEDKVRFELQRKVHGNWKRLARFGARKLKPGTTKVKLRLPAQAKGAARLVAIGTAGSATLPLRFG